MKKEIRWGIIGCGNVTEVKSGPAFNKVPGSKLIAVMRRNTEKAKEYAQRHKVPMWFDDAEALIQNPEINAIYVATPPDTHAHYAIMAMRAGKPVYVEKPMARTYQECLEMIKVKQETGIPLFVAYYRRMLPGFQKIKQLITSGIIGKPVCFNLRFFTPPRPEDFFTATPWRVIPEISGGGYFHDLASHQLDFLDYILGPLDRVWSTKANLRNLYDPEDFVAASFSGINGLTGFGTWNFAAPSHFHEDNIEIVGEKGIINFSCFNFRHTRIILNNTTRYLVNKRPQHVQQNLVKTVVEELRQKGTCPSSAESAARTSQLMDQIIYP